MLRVFIISMSVINMAFLACRADRFYCIGSGFIKIQLDNEPRSEHNIVPELNIIVEESRDTSSGDHCSWQFNHHSATAVNVILQGIDRKLLRDERLQKRSIGNSDTAVTENASIPYEIHYPKDISCGFNQSIDFAGNLTLQTFQVISLSPGDTLTVSIQRQQPYLSPFALRLTAIDVGYCTRLTTLHNSNCHHIIRSKLTLDETLAIMRQSSMQLANFESLMDVRNFIESNKVPEDVFPIKQPLDLKNPVRIGLFHAKGGQFKRFNKKNRKCEMESFKTELPDSVFQCASLRVNDTGEPVIEPVNCNLPMPALISFSETPLINSCLDCGREIDKFLMDSSQKSFETENGAVPIIFIAICVALLSLLVLILVLVVYKLKPKFLVPKAEKQKENKDSYSVSNDKQVKQFLPTEASPSERSSSGCGSSLSLTEDVMLTSTYQELV